MDAPIAFVDASAFVALADRDDASHSAAVAAYRSLCGSGYRLFTTDHALAEAYGLIGGGLGREAARAWLAAARIAVYSTTEEDLEHARQRVAGQTGARGGSLTDAISIVVMERLGVADAFSVDPAFSAELG